MKIDEVENIVSYLERNIMVEIKRFNDAKTECNYNEACIHEYARQCYQMILNKIKATAPIHINDVVYSIKYDIKGVVLEKSKEFVTVYSTEGNIYTMLLSDISKTGEEIDVIDKVWGKVGVSND